MQPSITVLICDDHKLIRETWAFILRSDPRFSVVAVTKNAEEAIEKCLSLRPEIVLMDINMPGINGIEATKLIRKYSPCSKIIGVSLHNQPAYAVKMIQAGASGYVTKSSSRVEMLEAIKEVYNGSKYLCAEIKSNLVQEEVMGERTDSGINSLSLREMEIINLIAKGSSSKEIGAELEISVKTVEVHRYNIMKKLKLKNSASLINFMNKYQAELI